jgi:hypothetical protein
VTDNVAMAFEELVDIVKMRGTVSSANSESSPPLHFFIFSAFCIP